jgi:hypothetical protein
MRKLFFALALIGLSFQSMSQKGQVGFQINPIVTFINNDDPDGKGNLPSEMIYDQLKLGYKAGINYNHQFTQNWALSPSFSFNYLVYGFKQILYDNGAIATFEDDLGYGSFELALTSKHYYKMNENQFLIFKIGAAAASNKLWAYNSSSSLAVDSGGTGYSYTNGVNDVSTLFTPRVIVGASIVNTLANKDKIEIGLTYNHSLYPVSDYTLIRKINGKKYSTYVAPVLSYLSLDIIYYLRPYGKKEGN